MNNPNNNLPSYIRTDAADVLLSVHVQPGAKRTSWAGVYGERLKIRLSAPPVDGQANAALCVWLAEQMGCATRSVSVDRGGLSRMKTVRIASGQSASELLSLIATFLTEVDG